MCNSPLISWFFVSLLRVISVSSMNMCLCFWTTQKLFFASFIGEICSCFFKYHFAFCETEGAKVQITETKSWNLLPNIVAEQIMERCCSFCSQPKTCGELDLSRWLAYCSYKMRVWVKCCVENGTSDEKRAKKVNLFFTTRNVFVVWQVWELSWTEEKSFCNLVRNSWATILMILFLKITHLSRLEIFAEHRLQTRNENGSCNLIGQKVFFNF